jgi:hypothetical protein
MKALLLSLTLLAGGIYSLPAFAQAPGAVTGTCKDGTTFSAASRRGACRGHGGVQTTNPAASAVTPASPTASAPAANAPATSTTTTPSTPTATAPAAAPGAGAQQVWVNTRSKIYHCQGDRYYGKTKVGSYVSEAAAKAEGDRPDHGKACS